MIEIQKTGFFLGAGIAFFLLLFVSGCQPQHYLIHSPEPGPRIHTWSKDYYFDNVLMHIEGARPYSSPPFPAVLVHPEAGYYAPDMRGILHSLADLGYYAIAADYKPFVSGEYKRSLFPWRSRSDVKLALNVLINNRMVDEDRIATMGFSQGGVFSLLIASFSDKVSATIAYYPVTDFENWLYRKRSNPLKSMVFHFIRRYFYTQSGSSSESQFRQSLHEASPYFHIAEINNPVLFIHGENDISAPLSESTRMVEKMTELGKDVSLHIVKDAGHVFNFKDREKGLAAWDYSMTWLNSTLNRNMNEELDN